jgi:hypothetical protein
VHGVVALFGPVETGARDADSRSRIAWPDRVPESTFADAGRDAMLAALASRLDELFHLSGRSDIPWTEAQQLTGFRYATRLPASALPLAFPQLGKID